MSSTTPAPRCLRCDAELVPGASFCAVCGHPVAPSDAAIETRAEPAALSCPWCGSAIEATQRYCARCGRPNEHFMAPSSRRSSRLEVAGWTIGAIAAVALFAAGIVVTDRLDGRVGSQASGPASVARDFEATHDLPNGDEWVGAGPSPLDESTCPGKGRRLCLVAVGDQPNDWIDELAAYFTERYGLSISVLPPISLEGMERFEGELVDHDRKQLDGGSVLEVLKTLYPGIWASGDVTLVALTGYDMFDRRHPELAYWYSTRDFNPGRFTLVSNARMDDRAWGDQANDVLLRIRTRKLVAREIGTLYYGFPPSDDQYSVMTEVFGSRAGVDQVSELLPVAAAEPTNRDVVLTSRRWEGNGKGHTSTFEIEAGAFEFCASITAISDRNAGLQVSLYTEDGVWVVSDSGRGAVGSLGCTPIPSSGRYELRMTAYDEGLDWSVTVQRVGLTPPPRAELPIWDTDATTRFVPTSADGTDAVFDELETGWSPWFKPTGDEWQLCWELVPRPDAPVYSPEELASRPSYLEISVNVEYEVGDVAHWTMDETAAGDSQCYSVPNSQPNGRLWVFVRLANDQVGYRLTLKGVELLPSP